MNCLNIRLFSKELSNFFNLLSFYLHHFNDNLTDLDFRSFNIAFASKINSYSIVVKFCI